VRPYHELWEELKCLEESSLHEHTSERVKTLAGAGLAVGCGIAAALLKKNVGVKKMMFGVGLLGSILTLKQLRSWRMSKIGHKDEKMSPKIGLFVYGTLKQGFHWHEKFLGRGSIFRGKALTVGRFPLVIGNSGVPYCLWDSKGSGHQIEGELYWIDSETLDGLDEYEGVCKRHYRREMIEVMLTGGNGNDGKSKGVMQPSYTGKIKTWCYFKSSSDDLLRQKVYHRSYTRSFHDKHYHAIKHIQVKQQLYLEKEYGKRFGVNDSLG